MQPQPQPQQTYHLDTYRLSRVLEQRGFTADQSEAVTRVLAGVLAERLACVSGRAVSDYRVRVILIVYSVAAVERATVTKIEAEQVALARVIPRTTLHSHPLPLTGNTRLSNGIARTQSRIIHVTQDGNGCIAIVYSWHPARTRLGVVEVSRGFRGDAWRSAVGHECAEGSTRCT